MKTTISIVAVAVLSSLSTGCAILQTPGPQALTKEEISGRIKQDAVAVQLGVQPVGAVLTLDEAIARAVKFNLDRRARLMEEALAAQQFEAGKYDILPKLVASAGYATRDSDRLSIAADLNGRPTGSSPTLSQERSRSFGGLDFTWSLIDFGLARYNTDQAANRVLAAAERRRKATHQLVQDVRVAFWRAVSAQRLQSQVRDNIQLAEEAIVDARRAQTELVRSPLDSLRYQRQLTENMRLLEAIDQELATARFELAGLINAPMSMSTRLAADQELPTGEPLKISAEQMEDIALSQNAELREQTYLRRIAATEARKVIARAFPNISLNLGARYDSDRYLVNNNWNEAGLQASYNLMNLLSLPAQSKAADAGVALADQRRLAVHVATVTQVNIARQQLSSSRKLFERADDLWKLDDQITRQMASREQAQAGSKLERVAAQTSAIVSLLRRYQALAQWHASQSRLYATLGLDPLHRSTDDLTLEQITKEVGLQFTRELDGKSTRN